MRTKAAGATRGFVYRKLAAPIPFGKIEKPEAKIGESDGSGRPGLGSGSGGVNSRWQKGGSPTSVRWSARLVGLSGLWIGTANKLADALVIKQAGRAVCADVNSQAAVEGKSLRMQDLKTRATDQLDSEGLERGAADESAQATLEGIGLHGSKVMRNSVEV